jgi:hypothetical protein
LAERLVISASAGGALGGRRCRCGARRASSREDGECRDRRPAGLRDLGGFAIALLLTTALLAGLNVLSCTELVPVTDTIAYSVPSLIAALVGSYLLDAIGQSASRSRVIGWAVLITAMPAAFVVFASATYI